MTASTATFGIELEIIPTAGNEVGFSARMKRALQEAGFAAMENSHYGRAYSYWQVKPDCTVQVYRNGRTWYGTEVVSPVLNADAEGFESVAKVCKVLEEAGATANINCGCHVHVGVQDKTVAELKNIVRAYGTYADEIDSVLPKSRRKDGSKGQWAKPIWSNFTKRAVLQRIDQATTCERLQQVCVAINGRYSALSLDPYVRLGTIEFRQHSGTVDATKAVLWAKWCCAFVERFSSIDVTAPQQTAASGDVILTLQGRGERRMPRRACPTKRMIEAMASGARFSAEELVVIAQDPKQELGAEHVFGWLKYAARTTGFSFIQDSAGLYGLQQTSETAQAQTFTADPFRNCFDLFEGAVHYFGRRRAALA